jgi:hypothetical protein
MQPAIYDNATYELNGKVVNGDTEAKLYEEKKPMRTGT